MYFVTGNNMVTFYDTFEIILDENNRTTANMRIPHYLRRHPRLSTVAQSLCVPQCGAVSNVWAVLTWCSVFLTSLQFY